jgi:hypothetical protein
VNGGEAEARSTPRSGRGTRNLRNRALLEMADRFHPDAEEVGRLVTRENSRSRRTKRNCRSANRLDPTITSHLGDGEPSNGSGQQSEAT